MEMTYSDAVVEEVSRRCTEVESGARNVDNILTNTLLPELSNLILNRLVDPSGNSGKIHIELDEAGKFSYT